MKKAVDKKKIREIVKKYDGNRSAAVAILQDV